MGAPDLLQMLSAKGLTLRPLPDGNLEVSPRRSLTDELRAMIRANKPELLQVLQAAQDRAGSALGMPDAQAPQPRPNDPLARSCALLTRRVWAKLDEHPGTDLAAIADDELEPNAVLIAVARRDRFACVLRVDPSGYDGMRLLELIRQHTLH